MDLKLLKTYFDACLQQQNRLIHARNQFTNLALPAYSIYEVIALKKEPAIDLNMIQRFIQTFNWETRISAIDANNVDHQANFKLHSINAGPGGEIQDIETKREHLKKGIMLLISYWGDSSAINYDRFCQMLIGEHEMPTPQRGQAQFKHRQMLFQHLMIEIEGLIKMESFKKAIFHKYKNMVDLFEMLTNEEQFTKKHLARLFLGFNERKEDQEIEKIAQRVNLPWNFDQFLGQLKRSAAHDTAAKEYKVFYSSVRRNKNNSQTPSHQLTTPRRAKNYRTPGSTKLTKMQLREVSEQSRLITEFTLGDQTQERTHHPLANVEILSHILTLEEECNSRKIDLVLRVDFDLQLVYQKYGKKFEKILNERIGVCNFSAFCKFIIPNTYEHQYLSFIRYQATNTISQQTQSLIEDFIRNYHKKQSEISRIWRNCDSEAVYRSFCSPSEEHIHSSKLLQNFTRRQAETLLERLDPEKKGYIQFEAFK